MQLTVGDYEIAAFFGCVLVFDLCERLWPARPVDRVRDLKLDLLSFAFALLANRVCNYLFRGLATQMTPGFVSAPLQQLQALPSFWKIALAIFLVDFIIYWIHRAQHNFEMMWRTHAWHHSIEEMYWFDGFRT